MIRKMLLVMFCASLLILSITAIPAAAGREKNISPSSVIRDVFSSGSGDLLNRLSWLLLCLFTIVLYGYEGTYMSIIGLSLLGYSENIFEIVFSSLFVLLGIFQILTALCALILAVAILFGYSPYSESQEDLSVR